MTSGFNCVVIFLQISFLHIIYVCGKAIGDAEDEAGANMMTGMTDMMHSDHDMHTGMDHSDHDHMDMPITHDMPMHFHISNHATILFESWMTMTSGEIIGAAFGAGIVAALYEGLKVARNVLYNTKQVRHTNRSAVYGIDNRGYGGYNKNNNHSGSVLIGGDDDSNGFKQSICSGWHWLQALLHMCQVFLSYCLMLIFMSYNAWLCIAVVIGAGIGYLLIGWMGRGIQNRDEHCH